MSFTLANPFFEKTNISSNKEEHVDAAKDIWRKFSRNIKNYTPNFYFTIKNEESGKYYHFKVSEEITKNNKVSMKLKKLGKGKINKNVFKEFVARESFSDNSSISSQHGGGDKYKKYDLEDDDSSSSSSSDYKISKKKTKGLRLIYSPSVYNVPVIGLPIVSSSIVANVALAGLGGVSFPIF